MRLFLFFLCWVFISSDANAVEPRTRKNVLLFETGAVHRGALGVSYGRNYWMNEKRYLATEVYAGLGFVHRTFVFPLDEIGGGFVGASQMIYLTKYKVQFFAGADLKAYSVTKSYIFSEKETFSGVSASPVIGFGRCYANGFTYRARLSSLLVLESNPPVWLSIGVAFGYSF